MTVQRLYFPVNKGYSGKENGGERVGSCRAKGRAVPAEGGPGRGRAETWRPGDLQSRTRADHGRQDTRAQGGILAKKDGEDQLRRVREDDSRSTGRVKSLGFASSGRRER